MAHQPHILCVPAAQVLRHCPGVTLRGDTSQGPAELSLPSLGPFSVPPDHLPQLQPWEVSATCLEGASGHGDPDLPLASAAGGAPGSASAF